MSLSKIILYGTEDELTDTLAEQQYTLDEIDEYGYTPLTQAVIVNSPSRTKSLLNAGADPNFTDLTGRSALHWATDNNNLDIARLLLEKGANSNQHTSAGQPVLAMPFLREQTVMKDLLYKAGSQIHFAQDFINAKVLGHRFDLQGRIDIVNPDNTFIEVEFEGFYSEFTLALVLQSLIDFRANFSAKHLTEHFNRVGTVIDMLQNAIALIKYQHYLIDTKKYNAEIEKRISQSPLLLPIAYEGHALSFIRLRNYLVRCDRGAFGRANGTVVIYRIGRSDRFNKAFIKKLLYKRQYRTFIDDEIIRYLELKKVDVLDLPVQLSGNCSWANVEAVIPAVLYLSLLEETSARTKTAVYECKKRAKQFLKEWETWDQMRALHFCIDSFDKATPARKASKAALLMAILFQQQLYRDPTWQSLCERIAHIITIPHYDYILRCYLDVFSKDTQKSPMTGVLSFLDDMGIHFDPKKRLQ